ncbi:MAG: M23 family metallopeptidase [Bacteroidales bacterium]|nr:M23 family metallopeptidase [Bacteroidales bacterium]
MHPKLKVFIRFIWKKRTLYFLQGMLLASGIFVLILGTRLNVYLPGYLDVEKRAVVMQSAMRIDSLEQETQLRMAYLNNMMDILRDRVKAEAVENLMPYDSSVSIIQDTLLTASERELDFVDKYEKRERFGLNALDELNPQTPTIVFMAPVRGRILVQEEEDTPQETRVELTGRVPVLNPTAGNVVSVTYLMGSGYHVVVQHTQDYVTIYNHLSSVMVEVGEEVKSGQVLGHAGDPQNPADSWVGLMVWHKGQSLDPETVMPLTLKMQETAKPASGKVEKQRKKSRE